MAARQAVAVDDQTRCIEAMEEPQVHDIVLKSQQLLPAIYFLFSRDCQMYAGDWR